MKEQIRKRLFELQDKQYAKFHSKLIPNIETGRIIGVRNPEVRKLAKECFRLGGYEDFTDELPHRYYEENNLHALIIEQVRDYDELISLFDRFLPFVDNWATCDIISPKLFKKDCFVDRLYEDIGRWISSDKEYTIRFGVCMLLKFFLDKNFREDELELVCGIVSEHYYVNMMRAWFFATAIAKQRESTLAYFTEHRLDRFTHNKAIQKSIESFRVDDETKKLLRTFKIK